MKTVNKTISIPQLEIRNDEASGSPREGDTLGYFITCDSGYNSPDKHEELEEVVKTGGDISENQEGHIKYIKDNFSEKIIKIYPVVKYEHSGISYSLGTAHGFDYSNNGFYIITEKSQKNFGTEKKNFEKVIKQEIETYNSYVNGEVYSFTLYEENGEVGDGCGGFYDIEDMKEHLPKEWKKENLEEYIV